MRAMRECPRSDGCFARDSSSRVFSLYSAASSSAAPPPYSNQSCHRRHTASSGHGDAMIDAASTPAARVALQEDLNFLVTNRIPRRLATQFMGWFSKIEQPARSRPVDRASGGCSRTPNLDEAAKPQFASLHDCFIRELKRRRAPDRPRSRRDGQPL